jgi:hypothetical protein
LAVLGYLLDNFRAYGADRLVLLLVLAEAGDCRRPDSAMPMFHDCLSDEGIRSRVGSLLHKDRAVEDLCWQKCQTTKWWEEAQKRGNQLVRIGQDLDKSKQALHELHGVLGQTEQQLAWWREKYQRTLTARVRRLARIMINAALNVTRNRNQ